MTQSFVGYGNRMTLGWTCHTRAAPSCDMFNLGPRVVIFPCPTHYCPSSVNCLNCINPVWTGSLGLDWSKLALFASRLLTAMSGKTDHNWLELQSSGNADTFPLATNISSPINLCPRLELCAFTPSWSVLPFSNRQTVESKKCQSHPIVVTTAAGASILELHIGCDMLSPVHKSATPTAAFAANDAFNLTHFMGKTTTKYCPFPWGSGSPPGICFLWSTRVHNQKSIWISSAVFSRAHGCVRQTDRHIHMTYWPCYICSKRPHLCTPCVWCSLITATIMFIVLSSWPKSSQEFTRFILRMQTERRVAANPQIKPTD